MGNLAGFIIPLRGKQPRTLAMHFKSDFILKAHESLIIHYTVTDLPGGTKETVEIQHFKQDATIDVHRIPIVEEG